jgi:NAD(P)-dependent dehydrogenase (short-subunit alcohol dehydrogenase family)
VFFVSPDATAPPRRAIITGASGGIGLEIARGIAAAGFEVLLPVRNQERGKAAAFSITQTSPEAQLTLADLDLADPDSVNALVKQLLKEARPIELLILNAGIVGIGESASDKLRELTFQTNFLSHVALTMGLLPLLRAGKARVVVQCSLVAARARLDSVSKPMSAFAAYRQSKLALALFGYELDRLSRQGNWGISVQFCHPGIVPGSQIAPEVRKKAPEALVRFAVKRMGNSPVAAAQTALDAAASPATTPRMYAPSRWFGIAGRSRERDVFKSVSDEPTAAELWQRFVAPILNDANR